MSQYHNDDCTRHYSICTSYAHAINSLCWHHSCTFVMMVLDKLEIACALLAAFSLAIAAAPAHQNVRGATPATSRFDSDSYTWLPRPAHSKRHVRGQMALTLSDGRVLELEDDIKSSLYSTLMRELLRLAAGSKGLSEILLPAEGTEVCSLVIELMDCRAESGNQTSDKQDVYKNNGGGGPSEQAKVISTPVPALQEKVNKLFTLEQVLDAVEKAIYKIGKGAKSTAQVPTISGELTTSAARWPTGSWSSTATTSATPSATSSATPSATPRFQITEHDDRTKLINEPLHNQGTTTDEIENEDILDLIEKTLQGMENENKRNNKTAPQHTNNLATDAAMMTSSTTAATKETEGTALNSKETATEPTEQRTVSDTSIAHHAETTDASSDLSNSKNMIDAIRDALKETDQLDS